MAASADLPRVEPAGVGGARAGPAAASGPATWLFPTSSDYPRNAPPSRASRAVHNCLQLREDGQRLVYTCPEDDAASECSTASIRTAEPILKDAPVYAFEVEILHAHDPPTPSRIAIGLQFTEAVLSRMPGLERLTLAVHGASGTLHGGGSWGESTPYLSFAEGDTVCVVVNRLEGAVSFFKNGLSRGVALTGLPSGPMYPCLGFELRSAEVAVNLGQRPFKFDVLHGVLQDMRARIVRDISAAAPPAKAKGELVRAVLDHLVHACCPEAARALASAAAAGRSPTSAPATFNVSDGDIAAMRTRRSLYALLEDGQVEQATALVEQLAPGMLDKRADVRLELNLQHFIELMRAAQTPADQLKAMQLARDRLRPDMSPASEPVLQEALLLLASANPRESPSAHLLEPSRRATVVKLVHAALMHSIGKEKHSELERMVAHLDVVQSEMAAESILVGRLVSLRAAIREGLPAAIALEPSPASHDTGMDIG